jgi:hypothetical protein
VEESFMLTGEICEYGLAGTGNLAGNLSNGESLPDVVDPGHEENGYGDDIVLTDGPKSDNALRALWMDGSV